jgi:sigma-E factor negative regulatory protein RseB
MVLYDVRRRTDASGSVLHLSYSDGLSTLSVFAQDGRLDASQLTGWRSMTMGGPVYLHDDGLARRIAWTGGDRVYTVVTDAPPSTLATLVAAWPHKQPHRGFWGRIGHGLQRLGSWLDPF